METGKLKSYAPKARQDLIEALKAKAALYGITEKGVSPTTSEGDVIIIAGKAFSKSIQSARKQLVSRHDELGFKQTIEHIAYTWFNRLIALRYMELKGFFDHGYRVISHPEKEELNAAPQILEQAEKLEFSSLTKDKIIELKLAGDKDEELYRKLLFAQCYELKDALPFMWDGVDSATDLLLPDNLLHTDSVIRKLVSKVPEELFEDVEVIGWLYQFYISEKKDEVIGAVVKSEDIPAATQLFTPNWIVKYLVQNSLGRQWLQTYPDSTLKEKMEYYITPAKQTDEVQAKLDEITPASLDPEELSFLDPACGSGHILVEGYNLLKEIYLERGYRLKDVPRLILKKNLFGLEIDTRAAQLSQFSLVMKAREDDRTILSNPPKLNIIAIEESNSLNKKQIIDAFSAKVVKDMLPADDLFPDTISQQNLKLADTTSSDPKPIVSLIDTFENAKTFGSLIKIPKSLYENLDGIEEALRKAEVKADIFQMHHLPKLGGLLEQSRVMGRKFDCVVANPPYMGRKHFNPTLKKFVQDYLPLGKTDLYAAFMRRLPSFADEGGKLGLITMQSWMFLSTSEDLRAHCLNNLLIDSMAHLGPRAFKEISGEVVQATAFAATNISAPSGSANFLRLVDFDTDEKREKTLEAIQNPVCGWFFETQQSKFFDIPGAPIAYWVSERVREIFREATPLGDIAEPQVGLQTSDSARFLRVWHEIALTNSFFSAKNSEEASTSGKTWFPIDKGGRSRKWFGNNEWVVNWKENGKEIKDFVAQRYPYLKGNTDYVVKDRGFYFRPGVTWNKITSGSFSARCTGVGFIFSDAGMKLPLEKFEDSHFYAGFLNSVVVKEFLKIFSETLNTEKGAIAKLPVVRNRSTEWRSFSACIELSKKDWDFTEVSWDFSEPPSLAHSVESSLQQAIQAMHAEQTKNIESIVNLETENNRFFIEAYGLEDELSPEVSEDEITLRKPDTERDMKELLSYSIGCMVGRYSLDKPGLIYANSGNIDFEPEEYQKFPADEDGIIPITGYDWHLDDDATDRFIEFISVAWPKEHLQVNLEFVAETLGQKAKEEPKETIRRYLAKDFFTEHCKMYKKRPIYWLVSSGKKDKAAFQALIYLHRYNEGTLARMRQEYVIPLQGKINGRLEQLEADIAATSQTSRRKSLTDEQKLLKKQQEELRVFDEKLNFYAQKRISLDLDDGVKVNYGKFGDLLVDVKKIHGEAPELEYKTKARTEDVANG